MLLPGSSAVAKHDDGVTATIEVVADGLNVPRGLVYDKQHKRLLIAEAGIDAINVTGPCGVGEFGTPLCYGDTGSIFAWDLKDEEGERILTGLPSESIPDGGIAVLGLHDLSLHKGKLTGVYGLLGFVSTRDEFTAGGAANADLLGHAVKIDLNSGAQTSIADITALEEQLFPGHESDPFGIVSGRYGSVVAHAGGNNVILVKPNGDLQVLAQIPDRVIGTNVIESVPTCVTQGPDGAFYFGELSGFPYLSGVARIWRVRPGHEPTIYSSGFTNIIDCTFDNSGRLIVLEIAKFGLLNADQSGALIRVERDGTHTELASTGMTNPGGVAVIKNDLFYVTNFTAGFGGDGQLLRVEIE
ncbi:MAG: ScyD/ScyE family protein [Sporichthyaceae bacterium]|nr:ScyD/ScyE family protein [Sporichthyaceae bacterium]